jgi:hypothetical protein
MNKHELFGKILASVTTAAIDAGVIALNPKGVVANPQEIGSIFSGFLSIWTTHPASGTATLQAVAPNKDLSDVGPVER